MKTKIAFIGALISCIFSPSMYSQQDEKESIGTQEVLVIKSYTPSLSDAFKINSSPTSPDSLSIIDKVLEFLFQKTLLQKQYSVLLRKL